MALLDILGTRTKGNQSDFGVIVKSLLVLTMILTCWRVCAFISGAKDISTSAAECEASQRSVLQDRIIRCYP